MEFLINTMVFTIDDPSQPQESFIPDFKNAALAALSSLRPTVTRRNESWWRMEKPWKNGWKRCGLPCGYVKIAIENCHLQLICLSKMRDFPQLLWFTRGYQVHFAKRCLTIFPTHVGQNGLLGRFKGEKHMGFSVPPSACSRQMGMVQLDPFLPNFEPFEVSKGSLFT